VLPVLLKEETEGLREASTTYSLLAPMLVADITPLTVTNTEGASAFSKDNSKGIGS